MSNDLFKSVNFTVGQEVRAVDKIDAQGFLAARLTDQVFNHLTPGLLVAAGDPDIRGPQGTNSDTKWAYALTSGGASPIVGGTGTDKKVKITAGTLFQKIASVDGDDMTLLPFTFPGTDEVTIADGHATLPRVDLIQMKLELETGDSQSRVFAQEAVEASLDTGPLATTMDTIYQAKNRGLGGNSIQIRSVSGGSPSYAESGNLVTLTFVDGVTTVGALEALVTANSTLIEIQAADGSPATVLASPGDVFGYTNMAGGVDQLLLSQSLDMKQRVKCTLSIKQGTAGSAPVVFPDPDSGYVPIAAVVVHALYNAGDSFSYVDEAEATQKATIMDLRMPFNVKRHAATVSDFDYVAAEWTATSGKLYVVSAASGSTDLLVKCKAPLGRLVGMSILGATSDMDAADAFISSFTCWDGGLVDLTKVGGYSGNLITNVVDNAHLTEPTTIYGGLDVLEAAALSEVLTAAPSATYGLPLWTNGKRAPGTPFQVGSGTITDETLLALRIPFIANDISLFQVVFWIAEGF